MAMTVPAIEASVMTALETLKALPKVAAALEQAEKEVDRAMTEQVELCEIPAPTFAETERAKSVAERMKAYGLTDVTIDEIGNVIGKRPGKGHGPILALGAHMDSVFPAGTDVTVKKEGNIYRAPGIGDNVSGLRALLQILRPDIKITRGFAVIRRLKPKATSGLWAPWAKKATATSAVRST